MRRWRLGTALVAGLLCLTGCTGAGDPAPEPSAEPEAEPTTLASYDARSVSVVRGPFCERISPTGLEHALGAPPELSDSWTNGDRVRLPDGSRDRVHEYGCSWTAADGTRATAWVFAPPVTRGRARSLVRDAGGADCTARTGVGFGQVSVTTSCTTGGTTEESYRGLFGDAWLTCTVSSADAAGLPERTSEWCVAVLEAARA